MLQRADRMNIPEETRRVAQRVFRKPTAIMVLRNELGLIYNDADFADLFSTQGRPGLAPGLLAMALVFGYMEGLNDRQIADAVRARIDLKYALGLKLDDPGFDSSVFSEFRERLVEGGRIDFLLNRILDLCRERGLLKAEGKQRTDSTHVVAAVRLLNRLELVMECVRKLLNDLAVVAPQWVLQRIPAAWHKRYGAHVSDFRLPKEEAKRQALAVQVGKDGYQLIAWLHDDWVATPFQQRPIWEMAAAEALRQVWLQQFYQEGATVTLRAAANMAPAAQLIMSPHDIEVRISRKRSTVWLGHKGHFTETCDEDCPHLVIHVETTPSTQGDQSMLAPIQHAVVAKGLKPHTHYVDSGYMSAANLNASQQQQINLVGPVQADTHWQVVATDGYGLTAFTIDWDNRSVTCPQGRQSRTWSRSTRKGAPVIRIQFSHDDCCSCAARERCTTAQTRGRSLQLHAEPLQVALNTAREAQQQPGFRRRCAPRAGIEGTIARLVNSHDLRRSRYKGHPKTALHHILAAAALNFRRLAAWFRPDYKRSNTPVASFAALAMSVGI